MGKPNNKLKELCRKALELARKSGGIVKPDVNGIAKAGGVSQPEASRTLSAMRYVYAAE